ncbi:MAG: type I-E CRISPR-associated protein Cse2/CasB [Syntrophobacterales bacterium]|nr:type I-E CRISPR-associated protein Cse2/CasB [Syntrophobacterales bacterium]
MNPAGEEKSSFIRYLEDLVRNQDRGALAALRRGLGKPPGTALDMHRYVVSYLPPKLTWMQEEAYFLLAALFAYWHQGKDLVAPNPPANLGASLAQMATRENEDSLDRRFTALLKSHREDLPHHLRQVVGLLKSNEVPVDWQQLLKDLLNWDHENQFVQRKWARSFWGRRATAATLPESETQNELNEEAAS